MRHVDGGAMSRFCMLERRPRLRFCVSPTAQKAVPQAESGFAWGASGEFNASGLTLTGAARHGAGHRRTPRPRAPVAPEYAPR